MNDRQFEEYLRRFRPVDPPPLRSRVASRPRSRGRWVLLGAAAAALLLIALVPVLSEWEEESPPGPDRVETAAVPDEKPSPSDRVVRRRGRPDYAGFRAAASDGRAELDRFLDSSSSARRPRKGKPVAVRSRRFK